MENSDSRQSLKRMDAPAFDESRLQRDEAGKAMFETYLIPAGSEVSLSDATLPPKAEVAVFQCGG